MYVHCCSLDNISSLKDAVCGLYTNSKLYTTHDRVDVGGGGGDGMVDHAYGSVTTLKDVQNMSPPL